MEVNFFDCKWDEESNKIEQAVREAAEFSEDGANDRKALGELRDKRRIAQEKAVADFFFQQPDYCSIRVRVNDSSAEIEDRYFGGSIRVYRPSVDWDWAPGADKAQKVVRPGTINASTWQCGQLHQADTRHVRREALHRLKMMDVALGLLNKYNEVITDWERIEIPSEKLRDVQDNLKRYQERERAARERENEKIKAREARKANK